METTGKTAIRASIKEDQVLDGLRRQIIRGELGPGSRLRTRRELENELEVSRVTLQRVLDRLKDDGFVCTKGPQGTYVVDHPPHLCRYELVFPFRDQPGQQWRRFWMAMAREATRITQDAAQQRRMSVAYHGEGHADNEDFQDLVRTVRAHRTAGLIFVSPAFPVANTPVTDEMDMPRVEIRVGAANEMPVNPRISIVRLDSRSFIDKALDCVQRRGRKRIAVVSTTQWFGKNDTYLVSALTSRFGEAPMCWRQGIDLEAPQFANNAVQSLMRGSVDERPDALIIADDNLVEHATAGLIATGTRVPDDTDVVAHCNFPWPTPSVVPVMRLGYDAGRVLQACIESIDGQRRGMVAPRVRPIEAVFEEELESR